MIKLLIFFSSYAWADVEKSLNFPKLLFQYNGGPLLRDIETRQTCVKFWWAEKINFAAKERDNEASHCVRGLIFIYPKLVCDGEAAVIIITTTVCEKFLKGAQYAKWRIKGKNFVYGEKRTKFSGGDTLCEKGEYCGLIKKFFFLHMIVKGQRMNTRQELLSIYGALTGCGLRLLKKKILLTCFSFW